MELRRFFLRRNQVGGTIAGGTIYTSPNSGGTWAPTSAPSDNWTSVACSSDGTKLVAVVGAGLIYISTNSGGAWTPTTAPYSNWRSVACTSDGSKFLAVGDAIYNTTQLVRPATTTGPSGGLTGAQELQ